MVAALKCRDRRLKAEREEEETPAPPFTGGPQACRLGRVMDHSSEPGPITLADACR